MARRRPAHRGAGEGAEGHAGRAARRVALHRLGRPDSPSGTSPSWRGWSTRIEPAMVSDHLCWGTHRGQYVHDLLPLPYTEEALAHVAAPRGGRSRSGSAARSCSENPSSYVAFRDSTMTEWEFLSELCRRAGCGILLDVNNVYVSARNFGFDPLDTSTASRRTRRLVPPGRPHRQGALPARHPRPRGAGRRLGPLPGGAPPLRPGAVARRVGRRHPAARGGRRGEPPRRGASRPRSWPSACGGAS